MGLRQVPTVAPWRRLTPVVTSAFGTPEPGSRSALPSAGERGSPIFSLAFTSNGSVLATGDQAGDIVLWPSLLWSTDLDAFSHDLCPRLRRNLTAARGTNMCRASRTTPPAATFQQGRWPR